MLLFLYYCIKVMICSGILYGYYLLALRNNRFHHWNRWYLLAAVVLSFSFPLLQIPLPDFFGTQPQLVYGAEAMALPAFYFAKQDTTFHFSLPLVAACVYAAIALFLLLLLAKNIVAIRKLKHNYPEETIAEIHFYNTAEPGTPFSFFKNIFWNSGIDLNTEKGSQMLRHEMAHVTEMHSADKVFLQVLASLAFWNPFLYLIKKELSVVHEFIADQKATAGDDKLQYASLLLMKAMGSQQYALGNPFFHSQLKRRLIMLTTNKNPRFSYIRRVLVLPLAAISLVLFSFKYKAVKDKQRAALQSHTTAAVQDELYGDTTKPKFYVQLNKTYKGSAIESIMPTTDMSGAIVKTVDDKTYFLDRAAAAKAFNFIITDSGFMAPPGAVLVTGTDKTVVKNGAFVQTSAYSSFPQYQYTIDTTAYGLSKAIPSIQAQDIHIDLPQDMHTINGPTRIDVDSLPGEFRNALIIVDGKRLDYSGKLKQLDIATFKSMDILKEESAIAKYGEAGKDGAIVITTKANKSLPGTPLYILDGVESTKEVVDNILPDNIQAVEVLKGEAATNAYGEKGKNGVVKVTTKLAKNEVTFNDPSQNKPKDSVAIAYRKFMTTPPPQSTTGHNLKEVVIVGYKAKTDDKVFTKVDEPASFPEGINGWRRYLERNLQYPKLAQEKGTQGTVNVQMTVNEDGNITDIKALNDPGNGLAAEAVRVISKGPKWIPAKQNGYLVTYRFVQNLTFQLQ